MEESRCGKMSVVFVRKVTERELEAHCYRVAIIVAPIFQLYYTEEHKNENKTRVVFTSENLTHTHSAYPFIHRPLNRSRHEADMKVNCLP